MPPSDAGYVQRINGVSSFGDLRCDVRTQLPAEARVVTLTKVHHLTDRGRQVYATVEGFDFALFGNAERPRLWTRLAWRQASCSGNRELRGRRSYAERPGALEQRSGERDPATGAISSDRAGKS